MDYLYGVKSLSFGGTKIGMISDEGVTIGGDAPTKTQVFAAQKKTGPVKVLQTTPGTTVFSFTLIELKAENLKQVFGGTVSAEGSYEAPTTKSQLEGAFELKLDSGETFTVKKGLLTASWTNAINMSGVLGVACELEVMEPGDDSSPYSITPV